MTMMSGISLLAFNDGDAARAALSRRLVGRTIDSPRGLLAHAIILRLRPLPARPRRYFFSPMPGPRSVALALPIF